MSSILKVDTLQDSGGNAIITSNGSGTFTSSLPNTGITEAEFWRVTVKFKQLILIQYYLKVMKESDDAKFF